MRMLALAGLAATLTAGQVAAQPPSSPPEPVSRPEVPEHTVVNPNDPYPHPPPPGTETSGQAAPKTKITGGLVAEAGGGVAGGLLARGAGTAVAGPVGGFAAGWIGSNLGGRAVRMVRRVFHHDKPAEPPAQAAGAPAAVDTSATEPSPR